MPARATRQLGMQETTLQVTQMSCKRCVAHVNRALSAIDGVGQIEVELRRGIVRIRHAPELTAAELAERVSKAGYPSQPA